MPVSSRWSNLEGKGEEGSEEATHGGERAGSTLGRVNGRGAVVRATVRGLGLLGLLARRARLVTTVGGLGLLAAIGRLGIIAAVGGRGFLLTAVGRFLLTTLLAVAAVLGEAGAVGLDLLDDLDYALLGP